MSVTVIGSLNVDVVTHVPRLPAPGETVAGTNFSRRPGGKGANQAVACRRAGAAVRMVGACGQDETGAMILKSLEAEGIDITGVRILPEAETGTAVILIDDAGENIIALTSGSNALVSEEQVDLACAALQSTDFLLLQLELPLAIVRRAADMARKNSATVLLNAAPASTGLDELLHSVDILIVNEHELRGIVGSTDEAPSHIAACAEGLSTRTGCTVITTTGPAGALLTRGATSTAFPAPTVDAVDTVGAGDTFAGYLAAGLSRGVDETAAIRQATQAAATMVTRSGTHSAIPRLEEIEPAHTEGGGR